MLNVPSKYFIAPRAYPAQNLSPHRENRMRPSAILHVSRVRSCRINNKPVRAIRSSYAFTQKTLANRSTPTHLRHHKLTTLNLPRRQNLRLLLRDFCQPRLNLWTVSFNPNTHADPTYGAFSASIYASKNRLASIQNTSAPAGSRRRRKRQAAKYAVASFTFRGTTAGTVKSSFFRKLSTIALALVTQPLSSESYVVPSISGSSDFTSAIVQ